MRSVTVGRNRYRVRVVQDAQRHAARKDDELAHHGELRGYIDWKNREIIVERGEPEMMASTLLHELLHEIFPFLDDDAITLAEAKLAPVVWRYGFRPFGDA